MSDWVKYDWEWKNDIREWKWIFTFADWRKYEWEYKNDKMEWKWIYTWADWRKYDWELKNGEAEWKWIFTLANWDFKKWIFKEDELYTWVFNINWRFDKYYVEWKEVSKSDYEIYRNNNSSLDLPKP